MMNVIMYLMILLVLFVLLLAGCTTKNEVITMDTLEVASPAFENNGFIPAKYTCQGEDINPPLVIKNIPEGTKSLVLFVDDPDAPMGTWVHWVVWNINITGEIKEDTIPGVQGMNDFGRLDYGGPCPPSGVHRYFFKVYALDCLLDLPEGSSKKDVESAMQGHVLASGQLVGRYGKS